MKNVVLPGIIHIPLLFFMILKVGYINMQNPTLTRHFVANPTFEKWDRKWDINLLDLWRFCEDLV